jgi:hypothetical protein
MDNTETVPSRLDPLYRERKRARWDPTINLGHIISATSTLVAAITFAVGVYIVINSRVVILEEAKTYQQARDLAQDQRMNEKFTDVQRALDRIENNVNELRRDVRGAAGERK